MIALVWVLVLIGGVAVFAAVMVATDRRPR